MRQIIAWFVEQAMSQSCPNQDAEEAIHKHRLELLLANLLLKIQLVHQQINCHKPNRPAQRVPAYREKAQIESNDVRIPMYE
jgi:hypothetical protein